MFWTRSKRSRRLDAGFGHIPDVYYSDGAMTYIRAYFHDQVKRDPERYAVDEITWNDLDMDRVFVRINAGLSTPGEQYLYDTLRHPALTQEDFEARGRMIALMEEDPANRLRVQNVLSRLGRVRQANLCDAFRPKYRGKGRLFLYLALLLALLICAALSFFDQHFLIAALGLAVCNATLREHTLQRIKLDFDTVNYDVNMVFALHRIRKLRFQPLDGQLAEGYAALERLRFVLHTGGLSNSGNGDPLEFISTVLLLDLITYEFLKTRLWDRQKELMSVFQALGKVDTAIAIASWRKSVDYFALPQLTFGPDQPPALHGTGLVHPLLTDPIPNDLDTEQGILLTGSNASGKSTFLRTVLVNALLAQSCCTALAHTYRANAFYLYSSMALSDDLLSGESYYIAEIKAIRRILEASRVRRPLLCVVDEVLRGTNTVERIAASSVILEQLETDGVLCLAATHDGELCRLLGEQYRLFHFQERIEGDEMLFDYRVHPGPAQSRNAICLLGLMGFGDRLVTQAEQRALDYIETGKWV